MNGARKLRDALVLLACLAVIALLAFGGVAVGPGPQRLWKGYLTLVLRRDVDLRGDLARLGVRSWVDRRQARVSFTVFSGMEQVSLEELEERLDPLDPRLDPYMRSLGAWFDAGEGWTLVYVRLDRPAPVLAVRLLAAIPGYGSAWRIADWAPATGVASVIVAAVLVAAAASGRTRGRAETVALAAAAAAWAPRLAGGDPSDLAVFLLLAAAWLPALPAAVETARALAAPAAEARRLRPSPFVPFVAALALALAGRAAISRPVVSLAILSCAFPAGAAAAAALEGALRGFREHPVFEPLRLGPAARPDPTPAARLRTLAPLALALPVLALGLMPLPGVRVPAPHPLAGARGYTWAVVRRLWTEGAASPLPDIADYVVHVAYQQALAYGRPYGLPASDVVLRDFAAGREPGRIEARDEIVIRYDDPWLAEALAGPAAGSVERLLLDQRSPVRVKYTALGSTTPGILLWNSLWIALGGALVLFPFEPFMRRGRDRCR